jgi:pSer/pThr/pTyr-binding forkhead associated (FHA) protein
MLQADLKVVGGKHEGTIIPLNTPKFLIGREEDCKLRPNSELVSRHHCVFTLDDYTLRLRDLGSTNGTFVNGERIRGQVLLQAGDRVSIGKLDFEVLIHEPAGVDEPVTADGSHEGELPLPTDTAQLLSSETAYDLPVPQTPMQPLNAEEVASGDTTVLGFQLDSAEEPPAELEPEPAAVVAEPAPAFPQPGAYGYPQPGFGGYPQQPYPYPQPMPPQPMAYPYPQPPMYPYPQQPYGYPQPQMQPPMPYPQPQPPSDPLTAMAPAAPSKPAAVAPPPVTLPPPESTGAKAPAPPPENQGEKPAEPKPKAENPSTKAADIIKQYMQRRPKT